MPYATEHDVRQQTFQQDFQAVPSAQIQQCLQTAHQDILANTTLLDSGSVTPEVIRAEVLLTVSHWYRMNAVSKASKAKDIHTSGIQVNEWNRISKWEELSKQLADEGWQLLRPYFKTSCAPGIILASGTSVLNDEQ